ncbi:beta-glucanase [Streptomyces bomunensis]|uniref:Beta-glucanase n=1 Tax=Streptomyces montanisoli TaxID=2798581 RepID=A0A940S0F1_9ACTN|nr:beta-glucanase [Streptomyces montanisoli]
MCFEADFASAGQWVAGRTSAYPDGGPVNPGDNKLDHLVSGASFCRDGTFRARRRPDGLWDTGLLTTEGSRDGFMVRTGDVLDVRVRLPEGIGAWPAVWTWRDGGNEVDVFEYHPDNPDLLELTNHVGGASHDHRDPAVRPGGPVSVRVEFGARSVVWWVDGRRVFADGVGVGRDWEAYLIVNLSVSAGRYHPAPEPGCTALDYDVERLRVHRH